MWVYLQTMRVRHDIYLHVMWSQPGLCLQAQAFLFAGRYSYPKHRKQQESLLGRKNRRFGLTPHPPARRISKALVLTPARIDFSGKAKAIVFETLKKRRGGVYRAVSLPEGTQSIPLHGLWPQRPPEAPGPHQAL